MIIRGRTRDTAWYSMIDEEWPAIRAAYEQWLALSNFDQAGIQCKNLNTLMPASTRWAKSATKKIISESALGSYSNEKWHVIKFLWTYDKLNSTLTRVSKLHILILLAGFYGLTNFKNSPTLEFDQK